MAEYAFVLADAEGNALPGSHVGRGRRLVYALNRPVEALITFSLADVAGGAVIEALRSGLPQLRVYRDGELEFSGHWHPQNGGSGTSEQSYLNLTFKDAFAELEQRYVRTVTAFSLTDAGEILGALVDDTNALSDTTLRVGSIEATADRDRVYEEGKQIAEAGIELTEVLGGFDFEVTPLDPNDEAGATGELVIVGHKGSLQEEAKFEFGPETLANLRGYTFTTERPINRAIAYGGGEPASRSEVSIPASEAAFRTQMAVTSETDVSEQASLDAKAADILRENPVWTFQIEPDPLKAPAFFDAFGLGDTVPVNIRDGELEFSNQSRVTRAELGIGDSGEIEDYVIGFETEGVGV